MKARTPRPSQVLCTAAVCASSQPGQDLTTYRTYLVQNWLCILDEPRVRSQCGKASLISSCWYHRCCKHKEMHTPRRTCCKWLHRSASFTATVPIAAHEETDILSLLDRFFRAMDSSSTPDLKELRWILFRLSKAYLPHLSERDPRVMHISRWTAENQCNQPYCEPRASQVHMRIVKAFGIILAAHFLDFFFSNTRVQSLLWGPFAKTKAAPFVGVSAIQTCVNAMIEYRRINTKAFCTEMRATQFFSTDLSNWWQRHTCGWTMLLWLLWDLHLIKAGLVAIASWFRFSWRTALWMQNLLQKVVNLNQRSIFHIFGF